MVGDVGFEPTISRSQTERINQTLLISEALAWVLSYYNTICIIYIFGGSDRDRTYCDLRRRSYSPLPYHYGGTSKNGSSSRARTDDQQINSLLLYQLSYRGMVPDVGFELTTYRLQGGCSTTELIRLIKINYTLFIIL